MKKKILAIWLDFDHCFYAANINLHPSLRMHYKQVGAHEIREHRFTFSGPIVDHVCKAIKHLKPDEIQIASFSNRQDFLKDNHNSNENVTHSSFVVFSRFVKYLGELFPEKKVILNKFLLADTYLPSYKPGTVWNESIKFFDKDIKVHISDAQISHLPAPLNIKVNAHEYKTDLFYVKAHEICQVPNRVVHALIYDDFEQALQNIYQLYSLHPDLLPRNFSADLFAFTSLTKINNDTGLSEKSMYLRQSILSPNAAPFYRPLYEAKEGALIKIEQGGVIDLDKLAKSNIVPGADYGLPEHYPYQSPFGEVCYDKKTFVMSCIAKSQETPDGRFNPSRDIKSYFQPKHTLHGTGTINKATHLFHPHLKLELEKRIDAILLDSWRNCPVLEPGNEHGVWDGDIALVDIYRSVIAKLFVPDPMITAFGAPRVSSPVLTLWPELRHRHFSYLMLPASVSK